MDEKELVKNCYIEMYRGMVEKDQDALFAVLDDSFVLEHMTGSRQPRNDYIKAIADGTMNYYSAEHHYIDTEIHGSTATLVGQTYVSAGVYGGERRTWPLQLDCKLICKGGSWKLTEAIASTF